MVLNMLFFVLFAVLTFTACTRQPVEDTPTADDTNQEFEQVIEQEEMESVEVIDPDNQGDMPLTDEDIERLNAGPEGELRDGNNAPEVEE